MWHWPSTSWGKEENRTWGETNLPPYPLPSLTILTSPAHPPSSFLPWSDSPAPEGKSCHHSHSGVQSAHMPLPALASHKCTCRHKEIGKRVGQGLEEIMQWSGREESLGEGEQQARLYRVGALGTGPRVTWPECLTGFHQECHLPSGCRAFQG